VSESTEATPTPSPPPDLAATRQMLADAHRHYQAGRFDEAQALARDVVAAEPDNSSALSLLGLTANHKQKFAEAVAWQRRAVAAAPGSAEALFNLGNALWDAGEADEAEACYRQALELDPNHAAVHNNLGNMLRERGRSGDAIECYRRAIAINPQHYRAYLNLGVALEAQSEFDQAAAAYRRALAIKPDYSRPYNNLGGMLKAQGRAGEAAAYYARAVELAPDDRAVHSNLLYCLQYDPAMTPGALLVAHQAYDEALGPARPAIHANPRDPDKPLNIGYLSADLRRHPVGFFMSPVVTMHDRANFRVYCYFGHRREDAVTLYLRGKADVWRRTVGIDDDELAEAIRADGIDILVDLGGHTSENRLPVFARRPAPVQATWAGYVGTTGVSAIDYLITDRQHSPPGSERHAVEQLVRLPDGYICWAIPGYVPDVGPLPATQPGAVTFGCFNNLAKLNPPVIALWGRLLRELPASRLLLKTRELANPGACARIRELFAVEGVADEALLFEGHSEHAELLARYNAVDIALDPFPYSGGLTTIEALWMGVPVVTMPGERFASRHSFSHLTVAGLGELVADGPEGYLRIATELARDLSRLAGLRAGLRERMRGSPLLQGERFTRGLENAYRAMWRRWCASAPP
jgi:protein O-GlcNAc transferase